MKLTWVGLSILSLVAFALMAYFVTVVTRKGISVPLLLCGVSLVIFTTCFFQVLRTKELHFFLSPTFLGTILLLGILSAVGNLTQYQAMRDAPNPGLALVITNLFTIPTAILAAIFLKDKLTLVQIIGITICLIGASLLSLGQLPLKISR